jgi:hypothetical protein
LPVTPPWIEMPISSKSHRPSVYELRMSIPVYVALHRGDLSG